MKQVERANKVLGSPAVSANRPGSRSFVVALVGIAALLTGGCNLILEPLELRFLYQPRDADPARLAMVASSGNGIEEVRLPTPDGVLLHGWLKHPVKTCGDGRFPLVIVFGGVRRETSWLIERAGKPEHWGWLFMNYRGFGLSEGRPSERVILEDARLIYDYAAARADVDRSRIVALGRSLGSYFTVALANVRPLRGAVLATPFDSFAALGEERYPWLPVGLILNGRYDAAAMAPNIDIPALFVLAENDSVTPVENGAALSRAWAGPRRIFTLSGARHYGVERRDEFWIAVGNFLSEIESGPALNGHVLDAAARD